MENQISYLRNIIQRNEPLSSKNFRGMEIVEVRSSSAFNTGTRPGKEIHLLLDVVFIPTMRDKQMNFIAWKLIISHENITIVEVFQA